MPEAWLLHELSECTSLGSSGGDEDNIRPERPSIKTKVFIEAAISTDESKPARSERLVTCPATKPFCKLRTKKEAPSQPGRELLDQPRKAQASGDAARFDRGSGTDHGSFALGVLHRTRSHWLQP